MSSSRIFGLMAEFETPDALLDACRHAHQAGYRRVDGYSPFPVHGLADALGFRSNPIPYVVLCGGIVGALAGYGLQYWVSVIEYPVNVGGRPLHSWPSFIPVTFEMTILVAAFSCVLGMFALNGLPEPYHPTFNVERFALASRDRFFMCIESSDDLFDPEQTRDFLKNLNPYDIYEVQP